MWHSPEGVICSSSKSLELSLQEFIIYLHNWPIPPGYWELNTHKYIFFIIFKIDYPDFEKNFYSEHEGILQLSEREIEDLRNKLAIKVNAVC